MAWIDRRRPRDAAAPVLKALASDHGYRRLAAIGSVARHEARPDSDIDLIVEAPEGTSWLGFLRFKRLVERVLGREIDLIDYGGLQPRLDDDIRREVLLLRWTAWVQRLGEAANRLSECERSSCRARHRRYCLHPPPA